MTRAPYAAGPKALTPERKRSLLALQIAGGRGLVACHEHPGARLAGLVSLGWATRGATADALGDRTYVITKAGAAMLADAKKGKAG